MTSYLSKHAFRVNEIDMKGEATSLLSNIKLLREVPPFCKDPFEGTVCMTYLYAYTHARALTLECCNISQETETSGTTPAACDTPSSAVEWMPQLRPPAITSEKLHCTKRKSWYFYSYFLRIIYIPFLNWKNICILLIKLRMRNGKNSTQYFRLQVRTMRS